jgi:hypothetical protein
MTKDYMPEMNFLSEKNVDKSEKLKGTIIFK